MTKRLKIEKRRSEIRSRLNEIRELAEADRTDAVRQEAGDLEKELRESEAELRAAIADEERDLAIRGDQAHNGAGESAEIRALVDSAEIGSIFDAVLEHRAVEGRERELQQHYRLGINQVPLALLETRAVTPAPSNVGAQQAEIIPGVFPMSVSTFLDIDMPRVDVGEAIYPVLTTNAAVGTPAKNAAQAETTGSFSAEKLSPGRLQAAFFWNREDAASFRGMGDSLRQNLVDALGDALDEQVLVGTEGLLTGTNLAKDVTAAAEATFDGYRSGLVFGRLDGTFAAVADDTRAVVGAATYAHAADKYRAATADVSALDSVMRVNGGVRIGAHVAAVANKKQLAVVRKGMRRDAVAPLWDGVTLIPDEVTLASNGQIKLTAVMLYAFKILRASGFSKVEFQVQP